MLIVEVFSVLCPNLPVPWSLSLLADSGDADADLDVGQRDAAVHAAGARLLQRGRDQPQVPAGQGSRSTEAR